ncbi:MAG: DUF1565 domain-containing protein [Deltaproteobacteria bacterium]|nr:DUF1565 domain-containing protein [Deltaproteobacteria bacterium]
MLADDSNGFFVDGAGGDDGDAGTKAAPFATIQKGVDEAEAVDGGLNVYIAAGTYNEDVTSTGASLFGGYEASGWTRDPDANVTTVNGQTTHGLQVTLNTDPVVVDGLVINGKSSIPAACAGLAVGFAADVHISNNTLRGGNNVNMSAGLVAYQSLDITVVGNDIAGRNANVDESYGA